MYKVSLFLCLFVLIQIIKADIKLCDNYRNCPGCGFYERCCFRQRGCGGPSDTKGVCACGIDDWNKHGTCN